MSSLWPRVETTKFPVETPRKSKAIHTNTGKAMLIFFFDQDNPFLIDILQQWITVNGQHYLQTLTNLSQAIESRRPSKFPRGVILLHDNARPHKANKITALVQKFKWKVLGQPPYSPDLCPCDYANFRSLKEAQRGTLDDDVKQYVRNWFISLPQEFYKTAVHHLVSQWDKCLNSQIQYFRNTCTSFCC